MLSELLRDRRRKVYSENSESLNAVVKQYVNFQRQYFFQFVKHLEECVKEQQNEVNKAAIGLGRWSLSPSYAHISQNTESMSMVEQQNALASLHDS